MTRPLDPRVAGHVWGVEKLERVTDGKNIDGSNPIGNLGHSIDREWRPDDPHLRICFRTRARAVLCETPSPASSCPSAVCTSSTSSTRPTASPLR